ncbi:MAG: DISARM system helicase DrmA, partial [Planctomycetaceae bacterium]
MNTTTPVQIRENLLDALRLDLVGPEPGLGNNTEVLDKNPSRWYLTGFLVPAEAGEEQKKDDDSDDELETSSEAGGADDGSEPDKAVVRRASFPSSMGVSVLLSGETSSLEVVVRWGDYQQLLPDEELGKTPWRRKPNQETVTVDLPAGKNRWRKNIDVPNSLGLQLAIALKELPDEAAVGLPKGTRSVSLFLVNNRTPAPDEKRDEAFIFQASLEVSSGSPFVPRPDLRSIGSKEWDMQVADLQYRDSFEYVVGHTISTHAEVEDGQCSTVRTRWIPEANVEKVSASKISGVELGMAALSLTRDFEDAKEKLSGFAQAYRKWIDDQEAELTGLSKKRTEVADTLLARARIAANRIDRGVELLADETVREAFCLANKAMAEQARRRLKLPLTEVKWRPFQLAFVLMNMEGIVDPKSADRKVVDLLFFPTGGGKTEAYLGLAAFTLVLRRLRNPGIQSAGLTVLMRYTLRLLTLDQLGRASSLICALELEREKDVETLGEWPFEIALWVGSAATPNKMGRKGDKFKETARAKTIAFKNDDRKPSPIPLEACPWCGEKFDRNSFTLKPNADEPDNLLVHCSSRDCEFSGRSERALPIVAVDEPIYDRLPCFMIATVDKFAAMPWTGEVGKFFGRAQRYDKHGFYGPCNPTTGTPLPNGELLPPELIIQDELHLISGPLGTVAGLYETALDELCHRVVDGDRIGPKVIASTATVRRAEDQIRALFNRQSVDIFPPPGPDRRDSFFAETDSDPTKARLYTGIAAPGRSPKKIFLKAQLCLMAAAQRQYNLNKPANKDERNPADPYMTVLGYFNSLRELGGARRIVEDEVSSALMRYGSRKRVGEEEGLFVDRSIDYEVVELTSRVSTAKVAEAKQRLELEFGKELRQNKKIIRPIDVALATNMISVGLDIVRLGLMLAFGQPKTSSEYIQSTSRVGRDEKRPGLVVTILNLNRPRDRSHYERFAAYHESFYRHVEATSVTPFSPRAMDRA